MSPVAGEGTRRPSLAPGTRLGPYSIEAEIGAGRMREVYPPADR